MGILRTDKNPANVPDFLYMILYGIILWKIGIYNGIFL